MKILKYLGIGLLVILVIVLILGLIAPTDIRFERSLSIKAPAPVILGQIKSLKNMQKWSPWVELDPNMKNTFEGTDGEVGSKNSWSGNDDVGEGSQTITSISETKVEADLHFIKPFESKAKVDYVMAADGEQTKVTWGFSTNKSFPMNGLLWMMIKMGGMNKDFDKGLGKLKALCESMPAEPVAVAPAYSVTEENRPEKYYAGIRKIVGWAEMDQFFASTYGQIGMAFGMANMKPVGYASALFYDWDEKNQRADVAPVMELDNNKTKLKGLTNFTVPAGKAVMVTYTGSYDQMKAVHETINKYIQEKHLEISGNVIEEYITDPMMEKDTAKWQTNVIYMVK
ncbi:MAG: GyrI-like domain-containing protein [Bacteroidia bacterium]|nr:GyrI-like domain-containing protein [Bacteroidia bacterium]